MRNLQRRTAEITGVNDTDRTVTVSFSSESADVLRWDGDLGGNVPEILSHAEGACDLAPFVDAGSVLRNHDPNQIIGVPVSCGIDATSKRGVATIRFGTSIDAENAWRDVRDKVLRGVSVGYEILVSERIRRGETSEQGHSGPCVLVIKWRVFEISLTPIPADPSVGVGRSQQHPAHAGKESVMKPENVRAKCAECGAENDVEREDEIVAPDATVEKKVEEDDDEKVAEDEVDRSRRERLNERQRVTEIQAACRNANLPTEFSTGLVNRGVELGAALRAINAELAKNDGGAVSVPGARESHIGVGLEANEKKMRHIEGNLAMRLQPLMERMEYSAHGSENEVAGNDAVFKPYLAGFRDVAREPRALVDFGRMYLELIGLPGARTMSRAQIAQAVFGVDAKFRAAAANVSGSLSNILANVQAKVMLKMYKRTKATWRLWCKVGNLTDFKAASRLRMSDFAELRETNEAGEILDSQISDEKEEIRLAVYARKIMYTWQMFVNDDLDALATMSMRIGQSAARLPSRLVYTNLLSNPTLQDGVNLFHSTHANLDTTASRLSSANLNTAYKNIQRQTSFAAPNDTEGSATTTAEPLELEPRILIVPPEERETALKLTVPNPYVTESMFFKDLNVAIEPRLSNAAYSGYSTTAYYTMCHPDDIDTYEVAFLDGSEEPIIQSQEDFDALAMKTRAYLACGVKALDYRGIHKSNGA